ncbi:MAG: RNA ligase (ATP) [Candidatus Altiarchaeales archaeon A3]|nr:MAG: RNA ligase (ATP) [Candidatus Altiarchaeales archaeon A3]
MERKLASIQKIEEIRPIIGADRIEMARVLGWQCVVKKDDYRVGDWVIYVEIDALIPRAQYSEFLFKAASKKIYKLKTQKFKGQISQGLIIPLSSLNIRHELIIPLSYWKDFSMLNIGDDVSIFLEITKYEPAVPVTRGWKVRSLFPKYFPKTNELRIQSFPDLLKEVEGKEVYISTKLDGTSMTAYLFDGHFGVCSRNLELEENPDNPMWKITQELNLKEKLLTAGMEYAIQGELVGPGVAKNPLNLKKLEWFIFNVFDIKGYKYLDFLDFRKFCFMGLTTVPIEGVTVAKNWSIEQLLERAKGLYIGTNNQKEGVVIRPLKESQVETLGNRLSFKVINNDILLKGSD